LSDHGEDPDRDPRRYRAPEAGTYVTDMAYLFRDERGAVGVPHDRQVMSMFSRAVWLELIAAAGFEPLVVPFEHRSCSDTGHEVFLGLRPVLGEGA